MSTPGLWLYGGGEKSIPTDRSVQILRRFKGAGKDFTIIVFPDAGHGLVDDVPSAPEDPNARQLDQEDSEEDLGIRAESRSHSMPYGMLRGVLPWGRCRAHHDVTADELGVALVP